MEKLSTQSKNKKKLAIVGVSASILTLTIYFIFLIFFSKDKNIEYKNYVVTESTVGKDRYKKIVYLWNTIERKSLIDIYKTSDTFKHVPFLKYFDEFTNYIKLKKIDKNMKEFDELDQRSIVSACDALINIIRDTDALGILMEKILRVNNNENTKYFKYFDEEDQKTIIAMYLLLCYDTTFTNYFYEYLTPELLNFYNENLPEELQYLKNTKIQYKTVAFGDKNVEITLFEHFLAVIYGLINLNSYQKELNNENTLIEIATNEYTKNVIFKSNKDNTFLENHINLFIESLTKIRLMYVQRNTQIPIRLIDNFLNNIQQSCSTKQLFNLSFSGNGELNDNDIAKVCIIYLNFLNKDLCAFLNFELEKIEKDSNTNIKNYFDIINSLSKTNDFKIDSKHGYTYDIELHVHFQNTVKVLILMNENPLILTKFYTKIKMVNELMSDFMNDKNIIHKKSSFKTFAPKIEIFYVIYFYVSKKIDLLVNRTTKIKGILEEFKKNMIIDDLSKLQKNNYLTFLKNKITADNVKSIKNFTFKSSNFYKTKYFGSIYINDNGNGIFLTEYLEYLTDEYAKRK